MPVSRLKPSLSSPVMIRFAGFGDHRRLNAPRAERYSARPLLDRRARRRSCRSAAPSRVLRPPGGCTSTIFPRAAAGMVVDGVSLTMANVRSLGYRLVVLAPIAHGFLERCGVSGPGRHALRPACRKLSTKLAARRAGQRAHPGAPSRSSRAGSATFASRPGDVSNTPALARVLGVLRHVHDGGPTGVMVMMVLFDWQVHRHLRQRRPPPSMYHDRRHGLPAMVAGDLVHRRRASRNPPPALGVMAAGCSMADGRSSSLQPSRS